jgi:hypothetical protein
MKVASRFLKISATAEGTPSKEGWLEIDIRPLDLDGVTKLHVNLDDIAAVRARRDTAASALDAWDAAFGKREEG